jgi:hypothetical protein
MEVPEGDLELSLEYIASYKEPCTVRLFINGKSSGTMNLKRNVGCPSDLAIGRFPYVSVTSDMREKQHYNYTNRIDRIEIISTPPNDMEKTIEMEQELKVE